jgi:hypothetical protein
MSLRDIIISAFVIYVISALVRDFDRWRSKRKEEDQLNRGFVVGEAEKHYYLIQKVVRYDIFVDEQHVGSADSLEQARRKGEWEAGARSGKRNT